MTEGPIISHQHRLARSCEDTKVERDRFFFVLSRLRAHKSSVFRFLESAA